MLQGLFVKACILSLVLFLFCFILLIYVIVSSSLQSADSRRLGPALPALFSIQACSQHTMCSYQNYSGDCCPDQNGNYKSCCETLMSVNHDRNCWDACHGKSGFCDWCGTGKACCR